MEGIRTCSWTLRRRPFRSLRLSCCLPPRRDHSRRDPRLSPHQARAGTPQPPPSQSLGSPHDRRIAASGGDPRRTLASRSSQTFRRFPPTCPRQRSGPIRPAGHFRPSCHGRIGLWRARNSQRTSKRGTKFTKSYRSRRNPLENGKMWQNEANRFSPFFSLFVSNLAGFAVTCTTFLLRPRQHH